MAVESSASRGVRQARVVFPLWLRRMALLRESPVGMIGAALVIFWILVAIFAPWLAPYDPNSNDYLIGTSAPPSATHWFGTDNQARDMLSRVIWGSRTVLTVAPLAVFCAYVVGCVIGLLAGYYRGWVDAVLMQVANIIMSFPPIILYIIIIMKFGPSAFNIIVAVVFVASPQIARLVRSQALELREKEYVAAAKMRGEPTLYILFREILPNALGPILVDALVRIGYASFAVSAFGFLGLGVPEPHPDWGRMVSNARSALILVPTAPLFPAFCIASLVIAYNLLADGLSEAK